MDSSARQQIETWRAETAERPLQSAQLVQDRLLDLYSALRAYPVISQVETWLTLTRARQLFEGKEIVEFLDDLEGSLTEPEPETAGA